MAPALSGRVRGSDSTSSRDSRAMWCRSAMRPEQAADMMSCALAGSGEKASCRLSCGGKVKGEGKGKGKGRNGHVGVVVSGERPGREGCVGCACNAVPTLARPHSMLHFEEGPCIRKR